MHVERGESEDSELRIGRRNVEVSIAADSKATSLLGSCFSQVTLQSLLRMEGLWVQTCGFAMQGRSSSCILPRLALRWSSHWDHSGCQRVNPSVHANTSHKISNTTIMQLFPLKIALILLSIHQGVSGE
jgi:hypothetical protein